MSNKKLKQNTRLNFITAKSSKQTLARSIDNAIDSTIQEKFTHLRKLVDEGYHLEYEFNIDTIEFRFCAHRYNHDTKQHEKVIHAIPAIELRKYFRFPVDRSDVFIELEKKKAQAMEDIFSFLYEITTGKEYYDEE